MDKLLLGTVLFTAVLDTECRNIVQQELRPRIFTT